MRSITMWTGLPRHVWIVVGVMDYGAPTRRGMYRHYHSRKMDAVADLRSNRKQWPDEPHRLAKYALEEEE